MAEKKTDDPIHWQVGPNTTWSTVNTAEAMPGVNTPLGWTWWADALELGMRGCFCDIGVLKPSEIVASPVPEERFSVIFYGRFVANIDQMRRVGDLMLGSSGDAVEEQIFGSAPEPGKTKSSPRRYPVVAVKMPRSMFRVPKLLARRRDEYTPWWRENTEASVLADGAGAPRRLAEARQRFQAVMRPHSVATMVGQAMYEQVKSLAEAAGLAGLETSLITGYGEMEEAEAAADLWDVSRDDMELEEFVAEHGFHGPSEGSLQSRSWREDDTPLRKLIETYRTMGDHESPRKVMDDRRTARLEAEEQLLAATPRLRRGQARIVLKLASTFIPLREVGKASFLQAIDVGRAAARSYGAHLAESGVLDDSEDVFYLTYDEVQGELPADPRAVVAERRAKRVEYQGLRLKEDRWQGEPEAVPIETGDGERSDTLEGMAVSPGLVEGRARVVMDPDAGIEIEPGEVLVCQTTDPSWASYFLVASALVIDIGGAMSHGAIVARELGIACVINTRTGTSSVSTGDLLRVDGGSGKVEVLDRAGSASPAP
jgi:phosphohistidine swiveling domain-containing protein